MTQDVFGIVGTMQGGSFRVERAVAEGGFSVIYRAQHGAFRAPVALKCLKVPGDLTASERASYLEKFREEAEILFRLSATIPEVVRPLHVDQLTLQDGRFAPFLALEWLEGEALDELIDHRRRNGQAPVGLFKLTKLLAPVARGLARAHRFPGPVGTISIVHRDIKPQNLFVATVAGVETVKILDFGIATAIMAAERGAGLLPVAETDPVRAFTPRYASPEQWEPERLGAVGPWTDVWGLAITMVEALAGRPALEGSQDDMRRRVFDTHARPTPRSRGVVISDDAESAFIRALAVDPRRRTRTVEAFWTELEAALRLPPSLARRDDRRDTGRISVAGPTLSGRPLSREEDDAAAAASGRQSALPASSPACDRPASSGGDRRAQDQGIALAATLIDPARSSATSADAGAIPALLAPVARGGESTLAAHPLPAAAHGIDLASLPEPGAPSTSRSEGDLALPDGALHRSTSPVESGLDLDGSPQSGLELAIDAGPPPSTQASTSNGVTEPSTTRSGPGADVRGASRPAFLEDDHGGIDVGAPLELDIDPRASAPAAASPIASAASAGGAQQARGAKPRAESAPVRLMSTPPRRAGLGPLALPLQLIGVGLLISLIDAIARAAGAPLRIGSLRPIWAGALLFVAGTALIFWRLLVEERDR